MALSWMKNPTDKDYLIRTHQIESAISVVMITTPNLCTCNFTTIICGRVSLVTNKTEVVRHSSGAIELLVLCLNINSKNSDTILS